MARVAIVFLVALLAFFSCKTSKPAKSAGDKKAVEVVAKEIKWMTIDEVQVAMKKEPRKVLIDFYTSWCGWCKVMDKKTYSNPEVIKYINDKFYAVKFDAERKDTIMFMGKAYGFAPENRANDFAVELLQGRLSYPTTLFFTENFQNPSVVPGYLEVGKMEMVLKFLGENYYQNTAWDDYQKAFVSTFKVVEDTSSGKATPVAPH